MERESSSVAFGGAVTWKIVVAYDGTDFCGWQVQPGRATVQGELARAIHRVTGETVLPQGSGRTDAGVHALAQVASCELQAPIPPPSLVRALNQKLPEAIRVLSAETVAHDFHARHSARRKTYEYRIIVSDPFAAQVCLPWHSRFAYVVNRPLDLAAMQDAAARVAGERDFTSFAASDPDYSARANDADKAGTNNVRTIYESSWTMADRDRHLLADDRHPSLSEHPPLLIYRVSGSGFLHHMVRNLAGTFLEVGWGLRSAADMQAILSARHRSRAGRTAPARGLFLHHVDY